MQADATDKRKYILEGPGAFVCADFAEAVHNNAEAAGIRAGWVGLAFEGTNDGHALNAFETKDKGLVYIDCTNSGITGSQHASRNWDSIAYIEKGKKYGVLPIERVLSVEYDFYPFEYAFYTDCDNAWQEYETKLKAYNIEVERYNEASVNKVFIIGSPEAQKMLTWKAEIQAAEKEVLSLKAKAGDRWVESEYSSYLVKSVNIHW
jgi:hypothetical protein